MVDFQDLMCRIKACNVCEPHLPLGANPIVTANPNSKIVIIGQAPGLKVHQSGIAWNDASGDALRRWLGVDKQVFYDTHNFAIVPMGFCYPGRGKSGDLPPRKECAPLWHDLLWSQMSDVKLILLIGQYAQHYYLKDRPHKNLTETVRNFHRYLPDYLPLPHPSPRNFIWRAKNPWFESEVLPVLKDRVQEILTKTTF